MQIVLDRVTPRVPAPPKPSTLAAILVACNIDVHPIHQVERFKSQMIRKVRWAALFNMRQGLELLIAAVVCFAMTPLFALGAGKLWTRVEVLNALDRTFPMLFTGMLAVFVSLLTISAAIAGVVTLGSLVHSLYGQIAWRVAKVEFTTSLYWHSIARSSTVAIWNGRYLPDAAQQLVSRIRSALPDATYEVHWLDTDPFLFVMHEKERYCVFHWDEPFETQ